MATIREKDKGQWQVQIRRKGWPYQTATFRSKKEAQGLTDIEILSQPW